MTEIKPIETIYNGYRFRSRLEARWAVFFDALHIKYEYEPEGFKLRDGSYYLPDFYLPNMETFVEIKREDAFEIKLFEGGVSFPKGHSKYAYAADAITTGMDKLFLIVFGDPYYAFPTIENGATQAKSHLFYVGECAVHYIFRLANKSVEEKRFYCQTEDGEEKDCAFCDKWANISTHTFPFFIAYNSFIVSEHNVLHDHLLPFGAIKDDEGISAKWRKFHDAQLHARQARFEHGETPKFN